MSNVPARVAADAQAATDTLRALAEAANPQTPPPAPPVDEVPPAPPAPPAPPTPAPTVVPTTLEVELQRMRQTLDSQQGRLQQQDAEIRRLQQAPPPAPAPAPAPPTPPANATVTAEDTKEYGEDLIDLMRRVARAELGTRVADLGSKVASLEGRIGQLAPQVQSVQQLTAEQARARYIAALDSAIPGWEAVNEDPAFMQWLDGREAASGKTYGELLGTAHNANDSTRVAHIFRLFKPDLGTAPAPASAPQAPAAPPAPPTYVDPASLAAPPTTAPSAPSGQPPAAPVWTMAQVDKLYDDKQKKRITPTEFERQEALYKQALREGRVVAQ